VSGPHDPTHDPVFRIMHATDLSPDSASAFVHALKLAWATGAELDVLHVSPQPGAAALAHLPGVGDTLRRWGLHVLRGEAGSARASTLRVGKIVAIDRDPVHAAIEYVHGHPTDLVVLGTVQRHGVERWLHKATAEPLARRSGTMTLFVPSRSTGFVAEASGAVSLRRVLLPVNRTPAPQAAVDATQALLTGLGCAGSIARTLHVGTPVSASPVDRSESATCTWESAVAAGSPVDEIVAAASAWPADLVVVTTEGHAGILDALRGSTTERILRRLACPLLAVPVGSRAMPRLFSGAAPWRA